MNAPLGYAVSVVQYPLENQPTSTDKIEAALNALLRDQDRANGHSDH
jgi:hypothetical protein